MFIGLVSVIMCFFFSLITGWLTDHIFGFMREMIIALLLMAAVAYYWFLLITFGICETTDCIFYTFKETSKQCLLNLFFSFKGQVYMSISVGMALHYSTIPLFYELAAEMAYPVHEVLVGGFVTASDCLFTSVFLLIFMIKDIGSYLLFQLSTLPLIFLNFRLQVGYLCISGLGCFACPRLIFHSRRLSQIKTRRPNKKRSITLYSFKIIFVTNLEETF